VDRLIGAERERALREGGQRAGRAARFVGRRGSGRLRGARGGGDDEGGRGDHAPGRGPGDHRWILPCPGVRGATEGRLVSSSAVACPSGRRSAPRKRVRCKPPWVQIPPL